MYMREERDIIRCDNKIFHMLVPETIDLFYWEKYLLFLHLFLLESLVIGHPREERVHPSCTLKSTKLLLFFTQITSTTIPTIPSTIPTIIMAKVPGQASDVIHMGPVHKSSAKLEFQYTCRTSSTANVANSPSALIAFSNHISSVPFKVMVD